MSSITVLYTANLRADLEQLPRVAAQLGRIRQSYGVNPPPLLLLDLGGAWSDEQWISVVTEHRAPYLVLDAMGYSVVHADGLDVGGIFGLQEVVQTRLIDASVAYQWERREMSLYVGNKWPMSTFLPRVSWVSIPATPSKFFAHFDQQLQLFAPTNAIGHLEVVYPNLAVQKADLIPFDPTIRPDPTIAATIEYVINEACAYARKQQKEDPPAP